MIFQENICYICKGYAEEIVYTVNAVYINTMISVINIVYIRNLYIYCIFLEHKSNHMLTSVVIGNGHIDFAGKLLRIERDNEFFANVPLGHS